MADDQQGDSNRRGAVIGAVAVVALLAIGLFLAHQLSSSARMQDCLLSGRTNCAPIESAK
jgi:hypothetical protein